MCIGWGSSGNSQLLITIHVVVQKVVISMRFIDLPFEQQELLLINTSLFNIMCQDIMIKKMCKKLMYFFSVMLM